MEEIIKKYKATQTTKIVCMEDNELTMSHLQGREFTKMDLIAFLLNSEEDFGLKYCKNINEENRYANTESIGVLYSQRYDENKRDAKIGYPTKNSELEGTFRIDNTTKRVLYNPYDLIPTYEFGKVNSHLGLITNSSVQDIIKEIVNQGYRIYNTTPIRNKELNINQHPNRLEVSAGLESAFHKITGKHGKETIIVGTETSLQDILEKRYPSREPIDTSKSVDELINQFSKDR